MCINAQQGKHSTPLQRSPSAAQEGALHGGAVVDWYSRRVRIWRLTNTMDVQFCVDAEIAQFKRHGIRIFMNGKALGGAMPLWSTFRAPSTLNRPISKLVTVCAAHVVGLRNTCSSTIQNVSIRRTAKLRAMGRTVQHCHLCKCRRYDTDDLA